MLSLSELAKIHKQKQKNKTKTYEVILNKCYKQIRHMAERNQTFCYYTVPMYVMGLPLYDINACIVYILIHLQKKGFIIQMAQSNIVYISWKHIHQVSKNTSNIRPISNVSQKNQKYIQPLQVEYHPPNNQINGFVERSQNILKR